MQNYQNNIKKINESSSFEDLYEFAEKKKYLRFINKFALNTLNIIKLKNFLIASIEEEFQLTKVSSLPYKFIIDPTNACNLGCPLCPTGLGVSERKKGILKFEKFKSIIDQVKKYAIEVHLYNWGEPTLNKNLILMLKYCEENNIWTRISSNLSIDYKEGYIEDLLKSGLDLLHVDVDGLDQEVYVKYRKKGNFDLVMKNIKKIKSIKNNLNLKKPIIELAMLAMSQNEHQHSKFLNMKEDLGVDIVKIDKIQHNPNMDQKWLPKNKDLIYESYDGGKAKSNSATKNDSKQCHWPWSGIVINYDGAVNPCCIIDDPNADFSNINDFNIQQIWNSEEYISARSEFNDKKDITKQTICNVCKNQTHSKRLSRLSTSFAIKL
jgi:radical SAM protein with 4Fe4S-binding SPASM domain